ncbi:MAG: hypothetical protein GKR87_10210 [Kiritimatiellae bacterium]|nr:hypothetical protein [Kiritimatiellia bacterium]
MKSIITVLVVVLISSSVAVAQSNVLSANAVGYVRGAIPSNTGSGFNLFSWPFENIDGSTSTMKTITGDAQLPVGSIAHIWNPASKTYSSETKSTRGGWPLGGNPIMRGTTFWIEIPDTAATSAQHTIVFQGEVPSTANGAASTTQSNIVLDAVAYPYPVDQLWTGTTAAAAAPNNSIIHIWDEGSQGYTSFTKSTRGGWSSAAGVVIAAGKGFWLELPSSSIDWTETKPYSYPQ